MPIALILISFGLCTFFSLLVLQLFPRWGLMDRPERYGHQRAAVPYPGGVSIFLSIVLCILVFLPLNRMVGAVLAGMTLLTLTNLVDDRKGLSPYLRLFIQFLAAVLLVLGGIGITALSNPLGPALVLDRILLPIHLGEFTYTLTLFADVLTLVWVMAMVNAFNWIDGVPGMTSSVSAVAAAILLLLSTRPEFHSVDQSLAITLSALILGASLAFLIFDFPPPRMLIGDTGSMLLGFLLAVTAIVSGGKIATALLVLGFPILDFFWVIVRRIIKRQSPFKGDLWHFHHRLLKIGLSEKQVVIFFAGTAMLFGGLSLVLHTEGKLLALLGVLCLMVLLAVFTLTRSRS